MNFSIKNNVVTKEYKNKLIIKKTNNFNEIIKCMLMITNETSRTLFKCNNEVTFIMKFYHLNQLFIKTFVLRYRSLNDRYKNVALFIKQETIDLIHKNEYICYSVSFNENTFYMNKIYIFIMRNI